MNPMIQVLDVVAKLNQASITILGSVLKGEEGKAELTLTSNDGSGDFLLTLAARKVSNGEKTNEKTSKKTGKKVVKKGV